jgi:hypothetical protein
MNPYPPGQNHLGDGVLRILHISNSPSLRWTGQNTGGLYTFRDSVIAKIAFLGHLIDGVKKPHSIRASHDAIAAADTPFSIHQGNSVSGLVGCPYRANLHAGWIFALVAKFRHKESLLNIFVFYFLELSRTQRYSSRGEAVPGFLGSIRKHPAVLGHNISLHPCPGDIRFKGNIVFKLAGFDTEAAADTTVGVYEEAPANRLGGGQGLREVEDLADLFSQESPRSPFDE